MSVAAFRNRSQPAPTGVVPQPTAQEPAPPPPAAIQRVGLVRFNPYHDTGGEYSFAVALLDEGGTGLLLTGLYHRDQSRVYAKEVHGWASEHELMDEEAEAIDRARGSQPV